jgi:hypothetical protein
MTSKLERLILNLECITGGILIGLVIAYLLL